LIKSNDLTVYLCFPVPWYYHKSIRDLQTLAGKSIGPKVGWSGHFRPERNGFQEIKFKILKSAELHHRL
jgi:hypothetical protein